jgi:photosystem II stability/assembly factor-like uncharacterized protein
VTELVIATGDELVCIKPQNDQWRATKLPSGRGMQCLAADARDVLYAGSGGEGVWKSTSRGHGWTRLDFAEANVFSVAVSPVDGAVYVGTEPSKLFVSRDDGCTWKELEALQQIPSRPSWSFPPRPWTSHVRSIAPSPHDAQVLLVGIELGGLMRSEDGGKTWRDHPPGAQKDVHALTWHPSVPGRAYEAGGGGAAWSRDDGISWHPADTGRDRHYTWGLAVDPNDPNCWYVSANPGARLAHYGDDSAEACIYRWRDGGPWQPLGGGLPQPLAEFPYALAMNKESLFAGLGDGRIYQSDDGGEQWRTLDLHGEPPECVLGMMLIS